EGAIEPAGEAAEPVATVDELPFHEALSKLVAAAIGRLAVEFSYRDAERRVEPWRLSFHRGRWYLVGWDCGQSAERLFRVDRIDGPVAESGPATRPVGEGPDPRAFRPWEFGAGGAGGVRVGGGGERGGGGGGGEPVDVRVLVDADQAGWACHRAGVDGERRPDGSVVLTLRVREPAALRTFVLDFLDHAEVLEPEWLRDELIDWLEALA
ncbi:MAG: WYL domain-containing protein, partial [Acidimicrobiaceae bacterium]|nr:WYL domain-containing protein [Acidimicrobiaceae bacterium]